MHEIWSVDSQENYLNYSQQMSDFKAKMHQIRFRVGLRPIDAVGEAYSAPQTQLDLTGLLLRGGRG